MNDRNIERMLNSFLDRQSSALSSDWAASHKQQLSILATISAFCACLSFALTVQLGATIFLSFSFAAASTYYLLETLYHRRLFSDISKIFLAIMELLRQQELNPDTYQYFLHRFRTILNFSSEIPSFLSRLSALFSTYYNSAQSIINIALISFIISHSIVNITYSLPFILLGAGSSCAFICAAAYAYHLIQSPQHFNNDLAAFRRCASLGAKMKMIGSACLDLLFSLIIFYRRAQVSGSSGAHIYRDRDAPQQSPMPEAPQTRSILFRTIEDGFANISGFFSNCPRP